MNVMVTGGAGFIGSHVVDALLEAGHNVIVIDNLYTGHQHNIAPEAKFYNIDLRDAAALEEVYVNERIDAVSHQGALANVRDSMERPVEYTEVNVIGTLNLLELAKKHDCQKFIAASTGGAVYGEGASDDGDKLPFTEETWPRPKDNYGASKLAMEFHIDLYYQNYGIDYAILRYPNVYGPRQDSQGEAGVVAIFTAAMLQDEPTKITGDGKQTRDFTFVGDIARASVLSLDSGAVGIFNLGTGEPTDINTVHAILTEVTGYSHQPEYIPRPVGEVLRTYLDSSKAKAALGWETQVSLTDGLHQTAEWFRSQM